MAELTIEFPLLQRPPFVCGCVKQGQRQASDQARVHNCNSHVNSSLKIVEWQALQRPQRPHMSCRERYARWQWRGAA
jgi:hypothetical protein